ncbi:MULTISPECIES: DUF167 domain-containing protein [unclassified Rhizobium]|uniref:DUF167 domain-containing protein n=1 Tax=unclassified Rhizobium TaxID=2613769 RepID=UPI001ADC5176|nr:DUF167 domain-containing protein [Rhizobium sp. 16-488-2b]MBO9176585.1 DUF167 domain-containing protein [Rhizobium sp. 16-488-2a]
MEHHRPDGVAIRPWQAFDGHVVLAVRLTPNGGRDEISGIELDADGKAYLKARVSVVPEKGKANKALIALAAKSLGVPKSAIDLISGDTSRKKILRIDAEPEDIIKKLEALFGP